jgi:hypothetical protein
LISKGRGGDAPVFFYALAISRWKRATKAGLAKRFINPVVALSPYDVANAAYGCRRMTMRLPLIALMSVAVVGAAPAPSRPKAASYALSVKVYDGDKLLMTPRLLVDGKASATILKSDPKLFVKLVARPVALGQFEINSSVVRWTAKGLWSDGSNLDVKADGVPGLMVLSQPGEKADAARSMRIEVTVKTAKT